MSTVWVLFSLVVTFVFAQPKPAQFSSLHFLSLTLDHVDTKKNQKVVNLLWHLIVVLFFSNREFDSVVTIFTHWGTPQVLFGQLVITWTTLKRTFFWYDFNVGIFPSNRCGMYQTWRLLSSSNKTETFSYTSLDGIRFFCFILFLVFFPVDYIYWSISLLSLSSTLRNRTGPTQW
jgi:hypothetical protein